MKKIIMVTILTIFVSISLNGFAADSYFRKPESAISHFFDLYQINNIDEAFDFLYSSNPAALEQSSEQISAIKTQLKEQISALIGPFYGAELIEKKELGNYLAVYRYLVLFEKQPITFNFVFYRPANDWKFYEFSYETGIQKEMLNQLRESSR